MLKQIPMPTVIKTNSHEAMFISSGVPEAVARHEKRQQSMSERIQSAEKELDEALNDGFKLVTQYEIKTDRHEEIIFVLHKPNS